MAIRKSDRYKKAYRYSSFDSLDKETKEETKAINVLKKLTKNKDLLTERENTTLVNAIKLMQSISEAKKELSYELKHKDAIEKRKWDNTLLDVKQKMIKKNLSIYEKLELYAKTTFHYCYSGLVRFQSLESHYIDNVLPTITDLMIKKDISFEEAFKILENSSYNAYRKNEVDKALIEFKDEIDALKNKQKG
jgi:hypothetical protein